MSPDLFPHAERDLVAALGLTQKAVRVVRADELEQKNDWAMVAGEVRYSDAGKARLFSILKISTEPAQTALGVPSGPRARAAAEKLAKDLGVTRADLLAAASETIDAMIAKHTCDTSPSAVMDRAQEFPPAAAVRTPGSLESLTCFKLYSRNTKIVEAKTAAGELVLVRVRENKNLRPGMVMKCRFAGTRIWELAQRLPRYRGRW